MGAPHSYRRSVAVALLGCGALFLVGGCAGESVRYVPTCQAAWHEIRIPEELRPFYPDGAAWLGGRVLALSEVYEFAGKSQEDLLAYTPGQGFTAPPVPTNIGQPAATLVVDDGAVFVGMVDQSGRYELSTDTWSLLPRPDHGGVYTAVSMGSRIAVAYERDVPNPMGGATRDATFYGLTLGDEAWHELAPPPFADWFGPALAWTGKEILAWGGLRFERGDAEPLNRAARYDPDLDAWSAMGLDGAPTEPGGGIVWTGSEAVAWGSKSYELASEGGRYDPTLDRWRPTTAAPPGAGFGAPVIVVNERVVSWTGATDGPSRVATYDPREDSWVDAPTRCGPSARRDPLVVWTGDGILVWGGSLWQGVCDTSECVDAELARLFYLPAAALFGEARDTGDCACPVAL